MFTGRKKMIHSWRNYLRERTRSPIPVSCRSIPVPRRGGLWSPGDRQPSCLSASAEGSASRIVVQAAQCHTVGLQLHRRHAFGVRPVEPGDRGILEIGVCRERAQSQTRTVRRRRGETRRSMLHSARQRQTVARASAPRATTSVFTIS